MKFQCGRCKKYFTINNIHSVTEDLEFQCDTCDNRFYITKNLMFSSSSQNSNILCDNCGTAIEEGDSVCTSCNLILNKGHENRRIDNKSYEALEVNKGGQLYNANSGKRVTTKSIVLPITLAVLLLSVITGWYLTKTDNTPLADIHLPGTPTRTVTQIVIMQSGKTYYADQLEKNGIYLDITTKNGATERVLEKDVMQIAKATIED